MNNTGCLNGLGMTEAKKKHQLMLNNGKHVSKNMFVLVISLKKLSQEHQLTRIIFQILALPPKYYPIDSK